MLVNHAADPAQRGKPLNNKDPIGEFHAVVALGDGSDERVVQTISRAGQFGMDYYNSKEKPEVQCMDRGDA